MNQKRKVCVISFSDLGSDPRVRRQLFALKDRYDMTALGLNKSEIEDISEFIIPDTRTFWGRTDSRLAFLFARLWKRLYKHYVNIKYPIKEVIEILKECHFDLVVANGLDSLVIAHSIAERDGAKILFDAHEYEPRRIEDHWFHKLFVNPYKDFLCKEYLPRIDSMTTSSYGFAEEYHRNYGIESEIIMNTPSYKKFSLKKVNPNNIQLVHHGVAHPNRKLEDMIKLMSLLEERFHLTLMLIKRDKNYFNYLEKLTDKICPGRISFNSPVALDFIVSELSHFDIGMTVYNPTSFNIRYALPNKLFEFITAGLCVIISPLPDMKEILEEFNCGFVSDSFKVEDIARMINSLTIEDIIEKKKASLKAAKFLNAENEMDKFKRIVKNLIGD